MNGLDLSSSLLLLLIEDPKAKIIWIMHIIEPRTPPRSHAHAYVLLVSTSHCCTAAVAELDNNKPPSDLAAPLLLDDAPPALPVSSNSKPTSPRTFARRLLDALHSPLYLPRRLTIPDIAAHRWSRPYAVASALLSPLLLAFISSPTSPIVLLVGTLSGVLLAIAATHATEASAPPHGRWARLPWLASCGVLLAGTLSSIHHPVHHAHLAALLNPSPRSPPLPLPLCRRHLPLSLPAASRLAATFPPLPLLLSLLSALRLLLSPPPRPFDALIKAYASLSRASLAAAALAFARSTGYAPSVLAYNAVLLALSDASLPSARRFLASMLRNGVVPNVYTYNILVRALCARGRREEALDVVGDMRGSGCTPNAVMYNTLVAAFCRSGDVDGAERLFGVMREGGVRPNLVTFNSVVNGLCKARRMEDARKVFDEMLREGFTPDEFSYNTLVGGYCKAGCLHEALSVLSEMAQKGVVPDVVTFTSLIHAMCRAGNLERAVALVGQMRERGLRMNEIAFTALIDGFCKKGFLDDALFAVKEMRESGIQPSVVCYNVLINGYCKLGRMDEAWELVHEMEAKGVKPDVVTYNTILTGYCKIGDTNSAFQLNRQMLKKGVLPDAVTYSSLIRGLCEERRLNAACELFEKMLQLGLQPDEFTYTMLIDGHCKDGNVERALSLHDEMIKKGVLPDVVTYSVLINGLSKSARTKEAQRLLFKLYYEGPVPANIKYDALMHCCSKAEYKSVVALLKGFCMKCLMNEADKVYQSMLDRNWKLDGFVYSVLIHGHCRGGNVMKALSLHKEMLWCGFAPNSTTGAYGVLFEQLRFLVGGSSKY